MRFHYISIRIAKIRKADNTNYCEGVGSWNSHSLLVRMQNGTVTLENSLAFSYKVKHTLTVWYNNTINSPYSQIPHL